jgi:hypothetical protein
MCPHSEQLPLKKISSNLNSLNTCTQRNPVPKVGSNAIVHRDKAQQNKQQTKAIITTRGGSFFPSYNLCTRGGEKKQATATTHITN